MEFVHHSFCFNIRNITKLATFLVAFFASFFSYSSIFTDGTIQTTSPKVDQSYICTPTIGASTADFENFNSSTQAGCASKGMANLSSSKGAQGRNYSFHSVDGTDVFISYDSCYDYNYPSSTCFGWQNDTVVRAATTAGPIPTNVCPNDSNPLNTYPVDNDSDGELDACANPVEVSNYNQSLIDSDNEASEQDNLCNTIVLDAGNNSASDMCYTSAGGTSCNVQKVTTNYGGTDVNYYQGVSSSPLGCGGSENPAFDQEGIGRDDDGCITTAEGQLCEANENNHTELDAQGNPVIDDGCADFGGVFMCDPSEHADVGEGDSDYFDDTGSCTVVAGSSYKGSCEDLGGTWSDEGDFTQAQCPSSSMGGSCSSGASICSACIDEGGTWTPDSNLPTTQTEIGINDLVTASKEANDQSKTLELTTRKSGQAIVSTVKSGNDAIISELKKLNQKTTAVIDKEPEKETFTTNTADIDKSAFNSLFDAASVISLEAEIETLKTEFQTELNTIRSQATTLMSITVPSSTGYEARTLSLTQADLDLSLDRFSSFFQALGVPVLLVCSLFAAFIILGAKD